VSTPASSSEPVAFRATIALKGRTAFAIPVPDEVVEALGGRRHQKEEERP
jgi:hypothetical protein